jgi:hypothetical protein
MIRDFIFKLFSFGGRDRCRVGERERMAFRKRVKHEFELHLRGSHFATQQSCSGKWRDVKARQYLRMSLPLCNKRLYEGTDMNGPRLGS